MVCMIINYKRQLMFQECYMYFTSLNETIELFPLYFSFKITNTSSGYASAVLYEE